ncbi:hypothetical protein [Acinetobacter modestus]|uniref:hypothetical protein n=1 Tax=Acinetobacter modestus TaxID=1776740 RepID=UPI0030192064
MLKRIFLVSVSLAMATSLPSVSFAASFSSPSRSVSVSPSRSVSTPVRSYTAVKAPTVTKTATKTVTRPVSTVRRPVVNQQPQRSTVVSRNRQEYDYYDFNDCVPYQSVTGNGWKCLDND